MRKPILFIFLACIGIAAVSCGYKKANSKKSIICDQPYVLCTSAQCIPSPSNPNELLCFCEVREGKSLGHTPCEERRPSTDRIGTKHLISTFSFDDFPSKKTMTCSSGNPWGDCLDQPCVVDPLNPERAICSCKLVQSGAYQTLGGNCNTSTCTNGFWSGATEEGNAVNIQALMKALGMEQSPARSCTQ